ncbi:MAG: DUF1707 domain-containing protein [Gemmatimonadota bacterium]|nr:DUF1707 domain-containing protein [Gemmatimonadota bacterium]
MTDRPEREPQTLEERKERAVRRLGDHFARDHISLEEFEARVDRAWAARDPAELEALFTSLPVPAAATPPATRSAGFPAPRRARADEVARRGLQVAVMGGSDRKGAWVPPRSLTTVALMGGAGLDLREARLGPGLTEITIVAVMGGVEVLVPPGLAVESHGLALLGGFDGCDETSADPDPDAPRVRIRGLAVMGGVDVSVRLPGESARDAKRRLKQERRRRRSGGSGGGEAG